MASPASTTWRGAARARNVCTVRMGSSACVVARSARTAGTRAGRDSMGSAASGELSRKYVEVVCASSSGWRVSASSASGRRRSRSAPASSRDSGIPSVRAASAASSTPVRTA